MENVRLNRQQSREIDRIAIEEYGLPGIVLMENAGRGTAEWLIELGIAGPVVICCGKGNNGGDGFVIARHLANRGYAVSLLLFSPPGDLTGDAAIAWRVVERMGLPVKLVPQSIDWADINRRLAGADWIVDALLGTGAKGAPREPFASAIRAINGAGRKILAVDLPSGLDCETGEAAGECVRADATATFVTQKTGFASPAAQPFLGTIRVISIGAPAAIVDQVRSGRTAGGA